MAVVLGVPITSGVFAQFAQRRDGDPAAEGDQCEARAERDEAAEAGCERDARQPNENADEQRGEHVAGPGAQRRPGRLGARPAALARDERDRQPVIGNHRVQHADRRHRADEDELRVIATVHSRRLEGGQAPAYLMGMAPGKASACSSSTDPAR